MTPFKRIQVLYDAGDITRCHTMPTQRQWRLATHVYGTQIIALELCRQNGVPPGPCLEWLLLHDAPEIHTGDIPAPTKWNSPELKRSLEILEERWHLETRLYTDEHKRPSVSELQYRICKLADGLDLLMICYRERMMGNRHPEIVDVFTRMLSALPPWLEVRGVAEIITNLTENFYD